MTEAPSVEPGQVYRHHTGLIVRVVAESAYDRAWVRTFDRFDRDAGELESSHRKRDLAEFYELVEGGAS